MSTCTRGWLALSMALLVAPSPLRGAQDAPPGVPHDLALVLLGGATGDTRIFMGDGPRGDAAMIPVEPDATVVGGLVRDRSGTLVVEVEGSGEEALERYRTLLAGSGWEMPPDPGVLRGGFQSSVYRPPTRWCKDGVLLSSTAMTLNGRVYLRLSYTEWEWGSGPCGQEVRLRREGSVFEGPPVPPLPPPHDARVRSLGGSNMPERMETEAVIDSEWTTERLFEHYRGLLEQEGWRLEGEARSRDLVISRWTVPHEEGDAWEGVFVAWASTTQNRHQAWLQMSQVGWPTW